MIGGIVAAPEARQANAQSTAAPNPSGLHAARDLQLEVLINGASTDLIAAFRQEPDGALLIAPRQLRNVGLIPAEEARRPDGLVDISRLPDVRFEYDEAAQRVHFTAGPGALAPRVIDAGGGPEGPAPEAEAGFGGLLNYTLFASTGGEEVDDLWAYDGASAWLEGRLFGPYGTLSSAHILSTSSDSRSESVRLDTTWSYSEPEDLVTYRVGDVITGGLSWTRPTRLGGVQIQRNFDLRPDLVTMPLPGFGGSAAVPSTVDVYVNNARRLSRRVPAGPFQITNLPVVTGGGTARVVVRDALGRETVSETPFFASSELLADGLWDFSAEAGFARQQYGTESDDYDGRPMVSGTVRYGMSDGLTLEGHAEGGEDLVNAGGGLLFSLGSYGVGSLAGSASTSEGRSGFQAAGSVELARGDWRLFARAQRTFGEYNDIASVTAERPVDADEPWLRAAPPEALYQLSASVPLVYDPSTLNVSYTQLETVEDDRSRILGLSYNRPFLYDSTVFATAFTDLDEEDSFGVFLGISFPLGDDIYGSSGVSYDSDGTTVSADLARSETLEVGSYGWRLRDTEGARTNRAAFASYRAPFARFEAGVEQFDDVYRAMAQMDGAVVAAGGEVFLSNRIDDAFAVVDAGAPGLDVLYENRRIGRTNERGRMLVPHLRSYDRNNLSIDPTDLPVDVTVGETREVVVPADRSGAVVRFDVDTDARAALVVLRGEGGGFVEAGSTGRLDGGAEAFVVGYDGQAYITGLEPRNRVVVDQPSRGQCVAEFGFEPRPGEQVVIPDVVCRAIR